MIDTLKQFLEEYADGADVWFLLPSGVIYGQLTDVGSKKNPETVTLTNAFYFVADHKMELHEATIRVDQIAGWGEDFVERKAFDLGV